VETVEYAVILGLITVAILLLLTQIGGWVTQQYQTVAEGSGEISAGTTALVAH
jgi:Flp pilus assembly pilin Flp